MIRVQLSAGEHFFGTTDYKEFLRVFHERNTLTERREQHGLLGYGSESER